MKTRFPGFVWCSAVVLWLVHSLGALFYRSRGDPWSHADWLISYRAGFVRRGASGSFFFWLSDISGIAVGNLVLFAQIFFAGFFFLSLAHLIARLEVDRGIIAMILVPVGFIYVLVDPAVAGRKEIILYALSMAWYFFETRQISVRFTGCLLSVAIVLLVLVHEGLGFFIPSLLLISLFANPDLTWNGLCLRAVFIFPALFLSFSVVVLVADSPTAQELCTPLLEAGYTAYTCNGSIGSAATGGTAGLRESIQWLLSFPSGYLAYFVVLFGGLALLVSLSRELVSSAKFRIGAGPTYLVWLCCFLASLPIYLIAVDWGRFVNANLVQFSIAVLALKRIQSPKSTRPPTKVSRGLFLASVIFMSTTLGISVSDAQYRSIVFTVMNFDYYRRGGLTPTVFDG